MSIVVVEGHHKDGSTVSPDQRRNGMKALGVQLKQNMDLQPDRRIIVETVNHFIGATDPNTDDAPANAYTVLYLHTDGELRALTQAGPAGRFPGVYRYLDKEGDVNFLVLRIDRDGAIEGLHEMKVTIPREDVSPNYLKEVVGDIEAIPDGQGDVDYLFGTITFRRCA